MSLYSDIMFEIETRKNAVEAMTEWLPKLDRAVARGGWEDIAEIFEELTARGEVKLVGMMLGLKELNKPDFSESLSYLKEHILETAARHGQVAMVESFADADLAPLYTGRALRAVFDLAASGTAPAPGMNDPQKPAAPFQAAVYKIADIFARHGADVAAARNEALAAEGDQGRKNITAFFSKKPQ